jgi:putative ABC transport system substrate-binding protein
MTTRRTLLQALALSPSWASFAARAGDRKLRVAILLSGFEPNYLEPGEALLAGLRELGYVEGRNLTVDRRYARLRGDQMLPIARELVALHPDLLITGCTGSTRAAMQATSEIPIVMASVADPVGQGFVRNLAQPATNVTGRSSQSRELVPKMLELLRAGVPSVSRVAVFVNTLNTVHESLWSDTVAAAMVAAITPVRVDVRGPADLEPALQRLNKVSAGALLVLPDDPMTFNLRRRVIDTANQRKLPALYSMREFVAQGGFMSYGESYPDSYRRLGSYVDKLARGAKAAELPIEQPTRFQLAVNMKTATLLGLKPSRALLMRADELIRA